MASFDLEEFDRLWRGRHDKQMLARLDGAMRVALSTHPGEYELLWRAARLHHFLAMQHDEANNSLQVREQYLRGEQHAQSAVEVSPHKVEGRFWLGVNQIEAARRTNPLAVLSALKKASDHLERAAKIDEAFHFAGPLRVLGRITHRKPLLFGGSAGVAIEFFKRALQIAPVNSTTQLYYAEALLTEQHKSEARQILNEIISAPDNEDWRWEQTRDRKLAQSLLKNLDKN